MTLLRLRAIFFFFNDTATTEIYTLSLHDALPIFRPLPLRSRTKMPSSGRTQPARSARSEEHTSELQSQSNLVCRLLLEKKKITAYILDLRRDFRVVYPSTVHHRRPCSTAILSHSV